MWVGRRETNHLLSLAHSTEGLKPGWLSTYASGLTFVNAAAHRRQAVHGTSQGGVGDQILR